MSWQLTAELDAFPAAADDFVRSRPVEHTTLLTVLESLRRRGPLSDAPVLGWWRSPDGTVDGVMLQTPPYPVVFSGLPVGAAAAAAEILADRPLPGANLLTGDSDDFVEGWRSRTGATATVKLRLRLHRLGTLVPPAAPGGHARTAGPGDRDLLLRWCAAFNAELGELSSNLEELVDDRLSYGGVTLWEDGGEPVAMAGRSRPGAGMVRVLLVYTPREHRGRGYAGATTTAVSQEALDSGATDVVLYTDVENPTSNGLYQRLGYRPVEDRVVVEFRHD